MVRVDAWSFRAPQAPMVAELRDETPAAGEVLVQVAGCAICPTDLAIFAGNLSARGALPLTLGIETAGRVVATGTGAEAWRGREVIVPSAIPCTDCYACRCGRWSLCPHIVFPGRSVHGGFASHVRVPAQGLCLVPFLADPWVNPAGLDLAALALVADSIATPYQALARCGLIDGDVAVFVGVGARGCFGVQIAVARGAHVLAVDDDVGRLAQATEFGAALAVRPSALGCSELKRRVDAFAAARGCPSWRVRVFETSGTVKEQELAFELLGPGRTLAIVGSATDDARVRLSNLASLDATVFGSSGCAPDLYPTILKLVLAGSVKLKPFVEFRPLGSIHRTFDELRNSGGQRRVVLVPN